MDVRTFIVVALVAKAYSGPVNLQVDSSTRSCARTCTESKKFQYLPRNTYNFEYEVETKTAMQGSSEDHSALKITANVQIEVITKCELALKLQNVAVHGSDPSYPQRMVAQDPDGDFRRALEKVPLRFSFQDGVVEELCPDDAETSWALNIKRGILSSFQNSMDSFDTDQKVKETDVTGRCHSQYTVAQRGWVSLNVKKSKDLMSCSDRHGVETMIQSTPYRLPKEIQSLPLLKSTHECDQEISTEGVLQRVLCHELHMFRPFSKDNSGAMTEATQKLTFVNTRPATSTRQDMVGRRSNLLFEHTLGESPTERNRQEAERKLQEICLTTEQDIRPETPRLFAGLVYTMKTMDLASLRQVYNQIKTRRFCPNNVARTKKFFVDAIPMLGTGAAVGMMAHLMSLNEITNLQAEMWLTSLAFIQHPTKEMLSEISPLMEQSELKVKVFLALSTMIHSYCLTNTECEREPEVSRIITTLEGNLGRNCRVDDRNYKTVLMSLRALGNAGHAERVAATLNRCAANADSDVEIRVAAAQAFRRLNCDTDRSELLALFRQNSEDSELRIEAYLAAMKCASDNILAQVKETLTAEEVNQVGSFVWSHLTNLMETSDPHKQAIRAILEDEILQKEFDLDKRKYSRNYEGSFFSEKLNMGAAIESNLIWSSKSFIPRSAMVNLTVDLFGRSINLLEVGGRMEGLEYFLESYYGPQGYFNSKPGNDVDEGSYGVNREVKRSKLDRLERQFGKGMDEFKASAYVRVFGNELRYMDLKNFGTDFNFLTFLMKMSKEQDYSFTQSFMFLDSSIIIPTTIGLPLNLTINGSASVDMKLVGRMDLRKPSTSLVIDGTLQPSGAVAVSAIMSIDAFTTKSGLKMASTLHSSSSVRGRVEMTRNQVLSVELDLPKERTEILDLKSSFFITHNNVETEQKMITKNRAEKTICTGSRLATITGLELCGEIQYPNASMKMDAPYFPLTGPVSLSVVLHKRDTHTGYKFEAKNIKTREDRSVSIMFDTPGSRTVRTMSVDAVVRNVDRTVEANLHSPWKKAAFRGSLTNNDDLKRLSGSFVIDETRRYAINSEVQIDRRGNVVRYTPNIELTIPRRPSVTLTGTVEYQRQQKMMVDLALNGARAHPVILKSTIAYTDDEMGALGSFSYEENKEYSFESRILMRKVAQGKRKSHIFEPRLSVRTPTEELVNLNGSIEHRVGKSVDIDLTLGKLFRRPVTLQGMLTQVIIKKKNRNKYQARITFQAPVGTAKFGVTIDKRGSKTVAAKGRWDYNFAKTVKWAKDTLKFTSKYVNRSTKSLTNYDIKTTMESARFSDYNSQVLVKMAHNDRTTSADVELRYGDNFKDSKKTVAFKTHTKHRFGNSGATLSYDSSLKYPAKAVDVHIMGSHEHTGSRVISAVHIQYDADKVINASLTLKNDTRDLPRYSGEVSLDYPGQHYLVATQVSQNSRRQYSANIDLELNLGQKTTVSSTYSHPSDCAYEVQCSIQGNDQEPIEVTGGLNMDRKNFLLNTKVSKGAKTYGIMASAAYPSENYGRVAAEFQIPARMVKAEFEGGRKGIQYLTKGDVQWDANRDPDKRLLLDVVFSFRDIRSFEGTVSAQYLDRPITANIKHQSGDRYITHGEVSWSRQEKIMLDLTAGRQRIGQSHKIEGSFQFSSPFPKWENVEAQVTHLVDRSQYTSKASFSWSPRNKVVGSLIMHRDITPRNLYIEGTVTTPFRKLKLAYLKLVHQLSNELSSSVIAKYGRDRIQLDVGGQFDVSKAERNIKGDLKWLSTIRDFESIILTVAHQDDLRQFTSKVDLDNNGAKHTFDFQMSHFRRGWQVRNSASFSATAPRDSVTGSWSHLNTDHSLQSSVTSTWGSGSRFQADLRGDVETTMGRTKVTGNLDMQIPSKKIQKIQVVLSHAHRQGFIRSDTFLKTNDKKIATFNLHKEWGRSNSDLHMKFTNPYMEDIIMNTNARFAVMPLTGHADFQWAPYNKITMDASVGYDLNLRTLDADLRFTTPFPAASQVVFLINHNRDGLDWRGTSRFEYSPRHIITVETRYRFDLTKSVRLTVTTPFQQASRLETGFQINGNLQDFNAKADFDLQPILSKISATADWNFERSQFQPTTIKGNLRITTPFPRHPYMQASILSEKNRYTRTNRIIIEYIPTQIIRYEAEYRMTRQDRIEGTMLFRSPFNEEIRTTFSHQGDLRDFRQFQTHADITYNRFQKIIADGSFSLDPSIAGSFALTSPIRGYETVGLNFNHKGSSILNFRSTADYETNGKKIEVETGMEVGRTITGKAMLKTPFPKLRTAQVSFSHEGKHLSNFHTTAQLQKNSQQFEIETGVDLQRKLSGKARLKTPFPVLRSGEVSFSHEGKLLEGNFHTEGSLLYNDMGLVINNTLAHDATSTSGTFMLKVPHESVPELRFAFGKHGTVDGLNANLELQYAPDKIIEATLQNHLQGRKLNTNFGLQTPYLDDITFTLSHAGRWNNFQTVIESSMGADNFIKSENSFLIREYLEAGRVEAKSVLTGILAGTKKVASMVFTHEGRPLNFRRVFVLEYDGKKYEQNQKINAESWKHVEVDIQAKSPVYHTRYDKYMNYHFQYKHDGDENGLSGSSELQTGGQSVSGTFKAIISPRVDVGLTVNTPFVGYEDLSASVTHQKQRMTYTTDASLTFATGKTITARSNVNTAPSLLSGNARITTPFTALQSVEVDFTHEGSWRKLKSTAMVRSSRFAQMQGEATLQYTSFHEMEGQLKFISSIEDYVQFTVRNSRQGPECRSHVELALGQRNRLTADGTWRMEDGRRGGKTINTDLTVSTPFNILRSGRVKLDHTHSSQNVLDKVLVEYNRETYLDMDTSFEKSPAYSGMVTIRKPRPMKAKLSGSKTGDELQGQAYIDWNSEDSQSNIQLDGGFTDNSRTDTVVKGFTLKAVHPSRTVGLRGTLRCAGSAEFSSTGEVIWDEKESKSASYSVQYDDRSRRQYKVYEGILKLRVPARSVEVTGSYNDNLRKKVVDAAILWDPEQDRSKKVDLKAEVQTGGTNKQVTLNAKLPTVNKDLSLITQWQVAGRRLFDGRTEFIYSRDSRKNLVLTSTVEDISTPHAKNYSLSLGLSHPYTNTDITMSGKFGHSDTKCLSNLEIGYLTAQRERKNLVLRSEINRLRQRREMDFEITTPTKSLAVTGAVGFAPPYHLTLRNTFDKTATTGATINLDPELQIFDLQMNYDVDDPRKSLHASGKVVDSEAVETEIYRTIGLKHITDSVIAMRMNTSRILHTRIHWRPTMLREITEFALNSVKVRGQSANAAFREVTETVGQEVAAKYHAISQSVSEEMEPISGYISTEMADLQRNLDDIRRELKRMYKRNDLYLREMGDFCESSFQNMLNGYTSAVSQFKRAYATASAKMEELSNKLSEYPLKQRYDQMVSEAANKLQEYRLKITEKIDQCLAKTSEKMKEYAMMYQEKLDNLADKLRDHMADGLDLVLQHPTVQHLRARYNNLVEELPELPALHDVNFQHYLKKMHWKLKKGLRGTNMLAYYNTLHSLVGSYLDDIAQMDELKQAYSMANEVYQQGLWTYRYWELDENFKLFMKNMLTYAEKTLAAEISQFSDMLANLDKSHIIEFDLDGGEIQFELYLPFDLDSFHDLPSLDIIQYISKYIKKLKYMINKYTPDRDICLWDYYYKYKPSLNPHDWVPPFTAYGIVSGNQHFITFDKHHFDFAGQCSYVLAKDFVDNNFTIILNYHDNRLAQKKSLLVMTNGKNVEIFPDYRMEVDSRPVELPYLFGSLIVHRSGHTIRLDNGKGLKIVADIEHDYYAVWISGWYFGKTAGLLGSYDNEPSNDVTGDVAQFASSWEVGSHCRSDRNFATSVDIDSEEDLGYRQCAALFKDSSSPFRPCFRQVEPQEFLHHCLSELDSTLLSEASLCNSSALYVHQCASMGVNMQLPRSCVRCTSPSGQSFLEGEMISMTGKPEDHAVPNSADVVVIVEEKACNRDPGQKLRDVVYNLEKALRREGLTGNQFGLMGFGGKEFAGLAHEHTIEGKLLNDGDKFAKGVESLNFVDSIMSGQNPGERQLTPSNSLDAIMAAARYPFRSGVSKTIVLMACSPCGESSAYSHSSISSMLKAREITLHILRKQNLELSSNRSPKNKIFGVDADEAYTPRDRNDASLDGSEDLFSPLILPSDSCTNLAMTTNGSLFDTTHIIEGNHRQQNTFLNVFSRRVSQSATPSGCQVCRCVLDDSGMAKSVCQGCESSYSLLHYLPTVPKVNPSDFHKQFLDFFGKDMAALKI